MGYYTALTILLTIFTSVSNANVSEMEVTDTLRNNLREEHPRLIALEEV